MECNDEMNMLHDTLKFTPTLVFSSLYALTQQLMTWIFICTFLFHGTLWQGTDYPHKRLNMFNITGQIWNSTIATSYQVLVHFPNSGTHQWYVNIWVCHQLWYWKAFCSAKFVCLFVCFWWVFFQFFSFLFFLFLFFRQ